MVLPIRGAGGLLNREAMMHGALFAFLTQGSNPGSHPFRPIMFQCSCDDASGISM